MTTQSNIISSGSEASDNEESHSGGKNEIATTKTSTRVTKSRGTKSSSSATSGRRSSRTRRSAACKKITKHFVEHNYHDHLHDPMLPIDEQEQANSSMMAIHHDEDDHSTEDEVAKRRRGGHRGGVAVPFPEKLHYMLSQMDQDETSHIVNWQPHGRCFVVHKPKEFVNDIMPKYFRQTKMTSFQRQLNLYGFARLTAGTDRGGYYHELFIRGRMDLCKRMCRTRVKGNGSKAASSPSTEPNFYSMEPCYEQTAGPSPMMMDHMSSGVQAGVLPLCDNDKKDEDNKNVNKGGMLQQDEDEEDGAISAPNQQRQHHPIVEDYEDGMLLFSIDDQQEGAEIVLKPIDEIATAADTASWSGSSLPSQTVLTWDATTPTTNTPPSSYTKSSPAIVSPFDQARSVVSPMRSSVMRDALFVPLLTLSMLPNEENNNKTDDFSMASTSTSTDPAVSLEPRNSFHSGDQVYFEGLPFHYLETKDIEDSLSCVVGV